MSNDAGVSQYPHADREGKPLPFSIGNLYGGVWINIGVAESAVVTLPSDADVCIFLAFDARAVIAFGGADSTPVAGAFTENIAVIPKNGQQRLSSLPASTFTVISEDGSTTGRLWVQCYKSWKSAGVEALKTNY